MSSYRAPDAIGGILVIRCCDAATSALVRDTTDWSHLLGIPSEVDTVHVSDFDASTELLVLKSHHVYHVPVSRCLLHVQAHEGLVHCYLVLHTLMTNIAHHRVSDVNTSVLDDLPLARLEKCAASKQERCVYACYLSATGNKPFESLVTKLALGPWTVWMRADSMREVWQPVLFEDV
jgi:hypothetical protein